MIAIARREFGVHSEQSWQKEFEKMLPEIESHLRFKFRHLKPEARLEAVQEAAVTALAVFRRLVQQGRGEVASAGSLAMFAARQVRAGRTVASRLNRQNPLSRYAQLCHGLRVQQLDCRKHGETEWLETAIEDPRAKVVDQVALRIDIPRWLKTFPRRTQRIARDLALGWSTGDVARRHRVTSSRISQLRAELHVSWRQFQGETAKHRTG